jgi:hypothetical protein
LRPSLFSDVRWVTNQTAELFQIMLVTATEAMYCNVTPGHVALTTAAVEKQKYYIFGVCVFVALVIQHAQLMRSVILSSVTFPALPHYLINGMILGGGGGGVNGYKEVFFGFLYNFCPKQFAF